MLKLQCAEYSTPQKTHNSYSKYVCISGTAQRGAGTEAGFKIRFIIKIMLKYYNVKETLKTFSQSICYFRSYRQQQHWMTLDFR